MQFIQLLETLGKEYRVDPDDIKKITGKIPSYKDKERYVAITTGQFRSPKKGEWYISGSSPVAFLAPNDLSTKYSIARIEKRIKKKNINWFPI